MVGTERVIEEFRNLSVAYGNTNRFSLPRESRDVHRIQAQKYLDWCAQHGVAPLDFMRERFRQMAVQFGKRPKLNSLRSAAVLKVWKSSRQYEVLSARHVESVKRRDGNLHVEHVRRLKMAPTVPQEAFKRTYILSNSSESCLISIEHSGGYHPQSSFCTICPSAVRCTQALNAKHGFDVVALRSGRLWELPARVAAAAVR